MATYSLYPGFILLHYEVQDLEHKATLPCLPVFDAGVWKVSTKGGADVLWATAITNYCNEVVDLYAAEDSFTYAELWTYDEPEGDPVFRALEPLSIAGESTGTILAGQAVWGFHTANGGFMKPTLMECNLALDVQLNYVELGVSVAKDFADYLMSADGWVVGRDGEFPIGLTHLTTKKNDKLRRLRFGIS